MAGALIGTVRNLLAQRAGGYSRAGLSVIAIRIGGAGLGLFAQVLAARHIGAEAFGYYALALVWLLLLGHGATAGTNQLVCRFIAAYRVENDRAAASGLLRFALMLAGGVAVALALAAIALVQSGIAGVDPGLVALWTLAFAVVPLIVLQDFFEAIARGLDKPSLGIAPAMLLRHVAIIAGVAGLMLVGQGGDALTIMSLTVAGLVASTVVQFLLIRKSVVELTGDAKPRYHAGYWFRTALPIAVLDAAEVLFNNADILILGLLAPPEIVAFYFAATRLSQILSYVPYGISAATAQKYSALSARKDRAGLQDLVASVAITGTVATAIAGLMLSILAAPLLSLFGPGYETAGAVVPVLCVGLVAVSAFGPGEDVLTMLGEERVCSAVFAVALVTNLSLNFALIPIWGMMGAAVATAFALALKGMLLAWFAHKRLGLVLPAFVPHGERVGEARR
jgi:O-antigen/teichoic acid export membrane protein